MQSFYKIISIIFLAAILCAGFGVSAKAAFNPQINYQGKLTDPSGNAVADMTVANGLNGYAMKFQICTDGSSTTNCNNSSQWTETWDGNTGGGNCALVPVTSGLFSIMLGCNATHQTSLAGLNFNQPLYLQVTVGTSSATWETLSPTKPLGAVPIALSLEGKTWESPGTIGSTTPATGTFTALTTTLGQFLTSTNILTLGMFNNSTQAMSSTGTLSFNFLVNQIGISAGTGITFLNFGGLGITSTGTGTFGNLVIGTGSANYNTFQPSTSQTSAITYVLPSTSTAGVLTNSGTGSLSWASASGGVGKYQGLTTTTYNGNLGSNGYKGGDADCVAAGFLGSHMCSTSEILYTINTVGVAGFTNSADAWINNGPPAYTANANDCIGRTSSAGTNYGTHWVFSNTYGGYGALAACGTPMPLACCK